MAENEASIKTSRGGDPVFGARLRAARLAAGKTLDTVAKHLGVSRAAIVQWEGGKRTMSALNAARIQAFLAPPPEAQEISLEDRQRAVHVETLLHNARWCADRKMPLHAVDAMALADLYAAHWPHGYPEVTVDEARAIRQAAGVL